MRKMEALPTIDEICRNELHLDKFIQEQLKAEIVIFRKAFEKAEGVYVTSEAMMDWTSPEIERMTAKFLEHEVAKQQSSGVQKVSAGEHFWDPAQGYVLVFPSDKEEISRGLNRLFAKQNRYKCRNNNARGEQRKSKPKPAAVCIFPPSLWSAMVIGLCLQFNQSSVEASDLPDVDEMLRAQAPDASPQGKGGVAPQTRSGRLYNNDLPTTDASLSGGDIAHHPLAAPVAVMTRNHNWVYQADREIESKPPKDLSSNATRLNPVKSSKVTAGDTPAQDTSGITSQYNERHADATNQERTANSFVAINHGLENATTPNSGMEESEIRDAIETAMRQLDPILTEHDSQGQGVSPIEPLCSLLVVLKLGQSKKRAHPEPVSLTQGALIDPETEATDDDVRRDKDTEPDHRASKKPKRDNKDECATRASESSKVAAQARTKVTMPRPEKPKSPQLVQPVTSSRLTPDILRDETMSGFAHLVDISSEHHRYLSPTDKSHTEPDVMFQRPHPTQTPPKIKAYLSHGVRAHTLPLDLDEFVIVNSKTQESPTIGSGLRGSKAPQGPSVSSRDSSHTNVVGQRNVTSDSNVHDSSLKIAPADGIIDSLEAHNDREMSQTLEPEAIGDRAVPATPPPESNDPLSPSRRSRIVVQFWILQARVPKVAWKQWANPSLSAQTVTTVFQAVNEHSQFRNVKAADVKFETDEQLWTYSIREDDPDHFDDMKRFITAKIKATLRKNRNNNKDFVVNIEPIGIDETSDEQTAGVAEDEMISGL
ncbi:MAG: hypothetical protein M1830_009264 [Pleopsidium flavum]|nr:MAG: hypothetical protein M1830_009264 [Pleopsidium flavum]